MVVLAAGSGSKSGSPAPSAPAVPSGERHISGSQWCGCTDRDYFEKLVSYAVDKDNEAFSRALARGLLAGVCVRFSNGERVFIADTAIFSGLVKVRRSGETAEYWTNLEAVK